MAEPDSNTITSEELATRVRRVVGRRFRRDAAARLEPATPKPAEKSWNWTAQGYDFLIISLALFLVTMLVLNLSVAGSWRERGNQWGDRARWQRELHAWEQQLAKQEKLLEFECQQLAASLIVRHGPEEQQQTLDQVRELRQRLREANQSLGATIRLGYGQSYASRTANELDSDQLSATALRTKREQLIEQQYAARSQYNAEHPALQAIEHQLEELDRQLAQAEESPRAEYTSDPESRVQVIENQYLRNANNSPRPRAAIAPDELAQQFQGVEQRFDQLRTATDRFLRDIDAQQLTLQQSDLQRATAWEQVANSLRAMARECAIPATLRQTVDKQDELRREPSIAPWSLMLCLVISLAIGGAIVWRSSLPSAAKAIPTPEAGGDENISVNLVTKQLGCAPGAILPWDMQPAAASTEIAVTSAAVTGKSLQQKMRFASECLLAVTIAATVLLTLTHGQFGDWLLANPLTAWGRWWGS